MIMEDLGNDLGSSRIEAEAEELRDVRQRRHSTPHNVAAAASPKLHFGRGSQPETGSRGQKYIPSDSPIRSMWVSI